MRIIISVLILVVSIYSAGFIGVGIRFFLLKFNKEVLGNVNKEFMINYTIGMIFLGFVFAILVMLQYYAVINFDILDFVNK